MTLINKEKFLNGVGKAVDVTNKAADKVETFVKEKEIDKKAVEMAKVAEKGIKRVGNKVGEVAGEVVAGYKSKTSGASNAASNNSDTASSTTGEPQKASGEQSDSSSGN